MAIIMGVGAAVYLSVCALLRVDVVATLLPKRKNKLNNQVIEPV